MADFKASIIITASANAAVTALRSVGSAAKSSVSAFRSAKQEAGDLFSTFGKAVVVANQGAQLIGRAYREASQAIGESVQESLRFRQAGDPAVKFFKDLAKESEQVKAKVGDILIPVIMGFSKATGAAVNSVSRWLAEHRKVIASGIVEWVGKLGSLMISVVARGTQLAVKAWMGLELAVQAVILGSARLFQMSIRGFATIVEVSAAAAHAIGADGMAGNLDAAAASIRSFERDVGNFGDAAQTEMELTAASMDELDREIGNVENTARNILAKGVASAMREVAKSTESGTQSVEEFNKQLERTERLQAAGVRGMQAAAKEAQAFWTRQASISEIEAKRLDEALEARAKAVASNAIDVGNAVGATFGEAIAQQKSLAETSKALSKSLISSTIEVAQRIIAAEAAAAAASAFRTHAGLGPGIGIILGAAAASTAFAAVSALAQKLASGGEVRGGQPGRDSVLAALMPGERVLTVSENDQLKRLMRSVSQPRVGGVNASGMQGFARGGEVQSVSSSSTGPAIGGVTLNAHLNLLDAPSSSTQQRRLLMRLGRTLESMVQDGALLRGMRKPRTV